MQSSWAIKAACAAIASTLALSASAIEIDVSGSSFQSTGKDTIVIKRLAVPGAGNWDVTFKWDPNSVTFVPQAVSQSTTASLKLSGPTTVNESSSITLAAVVQNADGTTVAATPTWTVVPASAGSISSSGVFTASSVTADVNAVATASFTHQGQPLTATYSVKVVNVAAVGRTCSGVLEARSSQSLSGDFTVEPDNRKINMRVTATAGNPYFFTSSLFFIQGTNTVDVSLYTFDADSAVLVPSGGWSGSGQLVSPGSKEGVIAAVPTIINLAQPFEIRYTGASGATSLRC